MPPVSAAASPAPVRATRRARACWPGAGVHADHRHQRGAHPEDQRDLEVLKPGAGAVAGQRQRAERAHQARDDHHVGVRQDRVDRAGQRDLQDLPEQPDLEARDAERDGGGGLAGQQEGGQGDRADGVRDQEREAGPGDPEGRERPEAEDQQRGQDQVEELAAHDDAGRVHHLAGAAQDAPERGDQPDQDRAAEDDVRVGQRRGQGIVRAAHRTVGRRAGQERDGGEEGAHQQRHPEGVADERVGVGPTAAAQRPRDGRDDAAAEPAVRHRRHQHPDGVDQRDAGQRLRPEPRDEDGVDGAGERPGP